MFGAIAAEIGQGCEIHHLRNLGEGQALVIQVFFQDRDRMTVDVGGDAESRHALDRRQGRGADEIRCGDVGENGYICKGFIIGL